MFAVCTDKKMVIIIFSIISNLLQLFYIGQQSYYL